MVSMEIIDPATGRACIQKRRQRYDEPGQPRELTFSCYRRYPFLSRNRTRQWSSARWFAGQRRVPLRMDEDVLRELQWDAGLREQR